MTEQEKNIIKNEIISQLVTDSRLIEQLVESRSLTNDDLFEISGGRYVSFKTIKDFLGTQSAIGDFLSRINDDIAKGHITFEKGLKSFDVIDAMAGLHVGDFVNSLSNGRGALIDVLGNAQLESLGVRGDITVNGFVTVVKGIKIGEATITWDSEHGGLKIDKSLYSMEGITALGIGDGGASSGGAGVDLFWGPWSGYNTADHDGTAVSGRAGKEIYDLARANQGSITSLLSRVSAIEGMNFLDALTLATSGTGNGVASVALSADKKTITVTKGTFLTQHQSLAAYLKIDGSNGTAAGVSALINKLGAATATPDDSTYIISQYVGNAQTSWHRRPVSALWSYVKGKADGVYQPKGNYLTPDSSLSWGKLTGKPTTIAGYGITDAFTKTEADARFVDFVTAQTVSGVKTFVNGIKIGSVLLTWDSQHNALKIDSDVYATGGITALGISDGSSSGGTGGSAYDRYDGDWKDFVAATHNTWVVSGQSGKVLYDIAQANAGSISSLASRIASLEGGSALTVQTTGSGNVVSSVTKSGTTITVTKGVTALTQHQSLAAYLKIDGSNGTAAGVSTLINKLTTGSDNINDNMTLVTSNSNPSASTEFYRRTFSYVWNYIKGKADPQYVTALGTSGNSLTWTKNGAVSNITVPYSVGAGRLNVSSRTNGDNWGSYGTDGTRVYDGGTDGDTGYKTILSISAGGTGSRHFQIMAGRGDNAIMQWRPTNNSFDGYLPWRTLLDTVNFASTLDSQYVKKAGDTMTGPLTVQTIHGINNQLNFFNNVAYISGSQLTPTTAKNGAMDLGKTDGRWRNVYSVLGNFTGAVTALSFASTVANGTAPFTVASTTRVANLNADMLDGVHVSGLFRVGALAGSADGMTVPGVYKTSAGVADTPNNVNGNQLLHFNWDGNAANQMYFCYNDEHVYTRRKAGGTWRDWKTFAFLDSTVAAADKLATSRKLWGQPFDGTAPVNGDMSGVGNLTMAGVLSVTGTAAVSGLITATGGIKIGDATITWDSQHGALKIDKSVYSTDGITALGVGDGSSSGNTGTAYDRYDGAWGDYSASANDGMVVSGKSGKVVYDLARANQGSITSLTSRVAAIEGMNFLDALTLATSGSGNAVASVALSADKKALTVTKGNFVPWSKQSKAYTEGTNLAPQFINIQDETLITDFGTYWSVVNFGTYSGGNFRSQIAMPYQDKITDTDMFVRTANGSTWRAWRRVLHSGNYKSFVNPDNFVTLTGAQTITGAKEFRNEQRFVASSLTYKDPWPSVACAIKVTGKIGVTDAVRAASFVKADGTAAQFLMADGTVTTKKTLTSVGNVGWTNNATDDFIVPTMSFMAYWNGTYDGNRSNLAYCKKGAFGDIVTHNHGEYVTLAGAQTITGLKTIDNEMLFSSAGWLQFNTLGSAGSGDAIVKTANNVIHAGRDVVGPDDANMRFGSWMSFGWYPTFSGGQVARGKNAMWLDARTGILTVANRLVAKAATGTAPLEVTSTTRVANLNADLLDGVHLNGLLTGMSLTGVNKNTLSLTVGGVTKTACITPNSAYGSRYFVKTDNGGRSTVLLIADMTALDSKTSGGESYGFTGRVTSYRIGGATNGCEHNIDIVCRSSWSSTTTPDLRTSQLNRMRPAIVKYQDKKYLAIILLGSANHMVMTGWWRNCLDTFTELLTPSGATLPEGVEIVTECKIASFMAESAEKLRTTRKLWGRPFNGEADVSGDMTGVGGISASGEISTSNANAFRVANSSYGVFLRLDSTTFYILQTASGDPKGNWNGYRPFSFQLSNGDVKIANVLKVKHNGNVGVGTDAPAYKLDIAGTVRMTGLLTAEKGIKIGEATITWDSEHGGLKIDKSLYSMEGITALGIGDGGASSGGAGVDLFWGPWSGYNTADHDGTAVSGRAGKEIYDLVSTIGSRVSTLEGGSALNVTTTGTGNVVTAVEKSGTSVTVTKGITAALSDHKHGLLHDNLTVTVSTATDSGWSMLNSSYNGFLLKSIRTQSAAPEWLHGNYAAGIAFGGSDTKGVMSMAYSSPVIKFAGGNGTGPKWWMGVKGTASKTYDLESFLTQHQSLADYVTLGTAQTITGAKTFSARARFNNVISAGEDADDQYAFINVCRTATIDNAACFSWVRAGNKPFALGHNTSNQIVMGAGKSGRTVEPWMKLSDSMLEVKRVVSTVATGTAPLQVASTTAVTNLNADMVDGLHASSFPRVAHGVKNAAGTAYILLGTLPQSSSNTWDSLHISGNLGGWGSAKSVVDVYVGAREVVLFRGSVMHSNPNSWDIGVNSAGDVYLILKGTYTMYNLLLYAEQAQIKWSGTKLASVSDTSFTLLSASTSIAKFNTDGGFLGNAGSATQLETSRTLWGRPFNGTANVSGDMNSVGNMIFNAASDNRQLSISTAGIIQMKAGTTNWAWGLKSVSADGATEYGYAAGTLGGPGSFIRFFYGGGYNDPAIVILANKYVGVGTTSPAYRLDVSGTANMASLRVAGTTEAASVSSAAAVINGGLGVAKNIIVDQGIKTRLGITSTLGNSGSALLVAQNNNRALMQTTNGYGNNYIAVTKTFGENGIFIQQQNGKYGYEYAYMKKTDIEAGNNTILSMFRLDEDGTVTLGSYNDLGTERMDKFMTVYRTMRLYRKSGVAVDVRCNENNELEVSNVLSAKNKIVLRHSNGKTVELSIDSDGSLRVNNNVIATGGVTALA